MHPFRLRHGARQAVCGPRTTSRPVLTASLGRDNSARDAGPGATGPWADGLRVCAPEWARPAAAAGLERTALRARGLGCDSYPRAGLRACPAMLTRARPDPGQAPTRVRPQPGSGPRTGASHRSTALSVSGRAVPGRAEQARPVCLSDPASQTHAAESVRVGKRGPCVLLDSRLAYRCRDCCLELPAHRYRWAGLLSTRSAALTRLHHQGIRRD
jgi:hypothetical protein